MEYLIELPTVRRIDIFKHQSDRLDKIGRHYQNVYCNYGSTKEQAQRAFAGYMRLERMKVNLHISMLEL